MTNKEIAEILRGCEPVRDGNGQVIVQSIANMQLVCLTAPEEFSINRFANPMSIMASNRQYGHLNIRNPQNDPIIVPAQIAVLNDASAQNHGMVKAAYISANSARDFNDAGCVQGTQTGHIQESHNNQIRFLPFGAKEYVFKKINNDGHLDNIYAAIERVGQETGANSGKYLDRYFNKFGAKIQEFIAHFERPSKCIGTIVFVDGEIVAIDKFPSYEYCAQVWDMLIRDCYGAIAITEEQKNATSSKTFTQELESITERGLTVAQRLRKAYYQTREKLTQTVKDRVEEIIDIQMQLTLDNEHSGYRSDVLESEGYIGQTITEGGYHHLVSIVKKGTFTPERFRQARKMRALASKQRRFKM